MCKAPTTRARLAADIYLACVACAAAPIETRPVPSSESHPIPFHPPCLRSPYIYLCIRLLIFTRHRAVQPANADAALDELQVRREEGAVD